MIIEYRRDPLRAWIYAIIAVQGIMLATAGITNIQTQNKITNLRTRVDTLQNDINALESQVKQYAKKTKTITAEVTAYSPAETCSHGDHALCTNAEGKRPIEGVSVACPRYIRLGQWVRIAGQDLRCDDRTAKKYDGRFDIYVDSYDKALIHGKQNLTVTIYEP